MGARRGPIRGCVKAEQGTSWQEAKSELDDAMGDQVEAATFRPGRIEQRGCIINIMHICIIQI